MLESMTLVGVSLRARVLEGDCCTPLRLSRRPRPVLLARSRLGLTYINRIMAGLLQREPARSLCMLCYRQVL